MRNRQRVRGIGDNDRGSGGLTAGLSNLRRRQRLWRRKMSRKNTTTTTEVSAEDRRRVQWIRDNNRGVRGSTTGLVDWKRQRSVYFNCYRVTNSNTVQSLYRCFLVLIFFHQIRLFLFTARNTISSEVMRKIFLYQVYINLAYTPPYVQESKKLRVLMINKDLRKSLARKNGNNIHIWSCNKPSIFWVQIVPLNNYLFFL